MSVSSIENKKRVSIVLPGMPTAPVGGSKVVFQYANQLAKRGCEVSIYFDSSSVGSKYPFVPTSIASSVAKKRVRTGPSWYTLRPDIRKVCIFNISDESIDDADAVIATAAVTARGVSSLSSGKGTKFYFIQDHECWNGETDETVRALYRLGMNNIVICKWLSRIVCSETGVEPVLIPDGIDLSTFHPNGKISRRPHEVSVLYHTSPHKGYPDAFAALLLAKQSIPDLAVNAFGVFKRPRDMPSWFTYTRRATPNQLRSIYASSAAYLCASVHEGFGLTGLEAMACGCPLVSTDYPAVEDYADASCAMLSPVHSPETLASNLVLVLDDSALQHHLSSAGIKRARHYDLQKSSELFCDAIIGAT